MCAQVVPKAVAQGGVDVPQQVEEQEVIAVGLSFFFDAAQQVGEEEGESEPSDGCGGVVLPVEFVVVAPCAVAAAVQCGGGGFAVEKIQRVLQIGADGDWCSPCSTASLVNRMHRRMKRL